MRFCIVLIFLFKTLTSFSQDTIPNIRVSDSMFSQYPFFAYYGIGDSLDGCKNGTWYFIDTQSHYPMKGRHIFITIARFEYDKKVYQWYTYMVKYTKPVFFKNNYSTMILDQRFVKSESWIKNAFLIEERNYKNDTLTSIFKRDKYEEHFAILQVNGLLGNTTTLYFDKKGKLSRTEYIDYKGNWYYSIKHQRP